MDIQGPVIAVSVDVIAANVLKHEIWLPGVRNTCVDQLCNMRMSEATQDQALSLESIFAAFAEQGEIQKLDGDFPLKPTVVSFRQPDDPHSSVTDCGDQLIRPDRLSCQPSWPG